MDLEVLLLAGGAGKRFWPIVQEKCLIEFCGTPIIKYIFDDLVAAGVKNFKIISRPAALPALKKIFAKKKNINWYIQENPTGMADAVCRAQVGAKPLIVVNPEDLLDPDAYGNFIKLVGKTKSEIVVGGILKKEYFPGGYLSVSGNRVLGIVEKPEPDNRPSAYINLVLHYFAQPKKFLAEIKKNNSGDDIYETALDKMIKGGVSAEFFRYFGYWQSLKYPWHVLEMMKLILENRLRPKISVQTTISPRAYIEGKVQIAPGAKILEGAVVKGPSFIGANTIIGTNALVRQSNIASDCVVGAGSEVTRSWLGPNTWLHRNYIGDSVIEGNSSFGAQALTANYRLDERPVANSTRTKLGAIIGRGTRVGVNASLMPGILVGANCFVGPGTVLFQDLPENKFYRIDKKSYKISDKK